MKFVEVDLLGVYVAPISVMMIAAWLLLVPLRRLAIRWTPLRQVWHPALFWFSVYLSLLSGIVLFFAR